MNQSEPGYALGSYTVATRVVIAPTHPRSGTNQAVTPEVHRVEVRKAKRGEFTFRPRSTYPGRVARCRRSPYAPPATSNDCTDSATWVR